MRGMVNEGREVRTTYDRFQGENEVAARLVVK